MFILLVRFELPDLASAEVFDNLTASTVPLIRTLEPGTLTYTTHRVEDEPLARVFHEVYVDRDAKDDHERQPHTAKFLTAIRGLTSNIRVEVLIPD